VHTGERVLVVGAGAIGGVTAGRLTRAGRPVTVLDANAEHVELMRAPGLRFEEPDETSYVPIDAVTSADDLTGRFDFALVTLKSPYLEAALVPLVHRDLVDTYVSLGNGLVQDHVAALVGSDRLLVGTVEWGATNLGPGHVRQTTFAPFVLGETDGGYSPRLAALAETLGSAARVRVSDNVLGQVWAKLLLNSTFSGLGAVCGQTYGEVVAEPLGRAVAFALWTEGYDVARTADVVLDEVLGVDPRGLVVRDSADVPRADEALAVVMDQVAATKASMLQDLERGLPTEVDVINGGVADTARRLGLRSPLNARLVDLVHGCERAERAPGPSVLKELAELAALRVPD
jgi:2-dehydropantoate 2-reductase